MPVSAVIAATLPGIARIGMARVVAVTVIIMLTRTLVVSRLPLLSPAIQAPLLLLVIAMALPLWQKRKVATVMQSREAELRQKAGAVIEIREKLEKEKAGFDRLLALRADYPPAIDVLRILTNIPCSNHRDIHLSISSHNLYVIVLSIP